METVYLSMQNTIDLAILVDGKPVDAPHPLSPINQVLLRLTDQDGTVRNYDSVAHPDYFSTTTQQMVGGKYVRIIKLQLGATGLPLGDYDAQVAVRDATYTAGIVVGEFPLQVKQG